MDWDVFCDPVFTRRTRLCDILFLYFLYNLQKKVYKYKVFLGIILNVGLLLLITITNIIVTVILREGLAIWLKLVLNLRSFCFSLLSIVKETHTQFVFFVL